MNTKLSWESLPSRFQYIRPHAEEFLGWLVHHKYKTRQAMDSLTKAHIARLATLYEEIDSRNHARDISMWLKGLPDEGKQTEHSAYHAVSNLFWVFRDLGKRNIAPFDSRRVEYDVPDPAFDWTKLPEDLRYLGEIAEKFGRYHGDDAVDEMTEQQLGELAATSEQIRLRGDTSAIFEWFKDYDPAEHPEAAWLATTVSLMEEAGVSIED